MKIALASAPSINNDVEKNVETVQKTAEKYGSRADLICFGEAFLHGFDALSWDYDTDKNIAMAKDSESIDKIKKMAQTHQVGIGFGFFEIDRIENSLYCAYMVVDSSGETMVHYRRLTKGWKDVRKADHHYQKGRCFKTFTFQEKRIALALCGDLWYEENIRQINDLKKDLVLWPLHMDYSVEEWINERSDYVQQASKVNSPVLMVNNVSKTSHGGAYHFVDNRVIDSLELGARGVLVVDI